jgi:hypothetical protein
MLWPGTVSRPPQERNERAHRSVGVAALHGTLSLFITVSSAPGTVPGTKKALRLMMNVFVTCHSGGGISRVSVHIGLSENQGEWA